MESAPVVLPNATAVSLDLPHYLPFDQWLAYLSYVKIIGQAWSWWLGDLLIAADALVMPMKLSRRSMRWA